MLPSRYRVLFNKPATHEALHPVGKCHRSLKDNRSSSPEDHLLLVAQYDPVHMPLRARADKQYRLQTLSNAACRQDLTTCHPTSMQPHLHCHLCLPFLANMLLLKVEGFRHRVDLEFNSTRKLSGIPVYVPMSISRVSLVTLQRPMWRNTRGSL